MHRYKYVQNILFISHIEKYQQKKHAVIYFTFNASHRQTVSPVQSQKTLSRDSWEWNVNSMIYWILWEFVSYWNRLLIDTRNASFFMTTCTTTFRVHIVFCVAPTLNMLIIHNLHNTLEIFAFPSTHISHETTLNIVASQPAYEKSFNTLFRVSFCVLGWRGAHQNWCFFRARTSEQGTTGVLEVAVYVCYTIHGTVLADIDGGAKAKLIQTIQ